MPSFITFSLSTQVPSVSSDPSPQLDDHQSLACGGRESNSPVVGRPTLGKRLAQIIESNWYGSAWGNLWLLPLWALYVPINYLNQRLQTRLGQKRQSLVKPPIIVVGNITVGGTGKTPFITGLAHRLQAAGYRVGIVSRGYGGQSKQYPLLVNANTPVCESGDEPALLAQRGFLVCVDPDRYQAVQKLAHQVDVIISDDGLQHRKMPRDLELVVVDGERLFGNGWQLPIGPCREAIATISKDAVICRNGQNFFVRPGRLYNLHSQQELPVSALNERAVVAVSGIGNPSRFHNTLKSLGADVQARDFADHHHFTEADLALDNQQDWLVMTEKDAVKCRNISHEHCWVLTVEAEVDQALNQQLQMKLASIGCPTT